MLDGAHRRIRAVAPALAAPVVLVAGEGSLMDRELRDRKLPPGVGRPQVREEQLEEAGIAQFGRFLRWRREPCADRGAAHGR